MCEQYSHTLIAVDPEYVPVPHDVQQFVAEIVELGVVPSPHEFVLRTPSKSTRKGINPFTGEMVEIPCSDATSIANLGQFEEIVTGLCDYEFEVSGSGTPQLDPIPIEFDEPYFVVVTCKVSSTLRSTSDDHSEPPSADDVVRYDEPCEHHVEFGIFTNPDTGATIEVPNAGAARFWIEFELGKFLFPSLVDNSLEILAPPIVNAAERAFGIPFAQGCWWG